MRGLGRCLSSLRPSPAGTTAHHRHTLAQHRTEPDGERGNMQRDMQSNVHAGATLALVIRRKNGEVTQVPMVRRFDKADEVSVDEVGGV